jgi:hypothetical protein
VGSAGAKAGVALKVLRGEEKPPIYEQGRTRMRNKIKKVFMSFIILGMAFGFLNGCDSGDKVIDEATGNRAVKQYEVTKNKLKAIDEQQKEKYQTIPGDEERESK